MGISSKLSSIGAVAVLTVTWGVTAAQADVVKGDKKDNVLVGTNGADRITGRGGDDEIDGRKGADVLKGNGGRDRLEDGGDAAKDKIYGGPGSDIISTTGRDQVFGGGGGDTIVASGVRKQMLIDCGAGKDFVQYGVEDEVPRTKNCEQVVFFDEESIPTDG